MSGIGVMTSLHERRRPLGDRREAQVAVGHHADELLVVADDRQARDAVLAADRVELLEGAVRTDGDRVGDHAGLGPLDEVDLVGLVLDREVAVQHPEAALAGHRDRHAGLGDGVHGRGDERRPDRQLAGEARRRVDVAGGEVAVARQEQDVVVRQPHRGESSGHVRRSEAHCPILRVGTGRVRTRVRGWADRSRRRGAAWWRRGCRRRRRPRSERCRCPGGGCPGSVSVPSGPPMARGTAARVAVGAGFLTSLPSRSPPLVVPLPPLVAGEGFLPLVDACAAPACLPPPWSGRPAGPRLPPYRPGWPPLPVLPLPVAPVPGVPPSRRLPAPERPGDDTAAGTSTMAPSSRRASTSALALGAAVTSAGGPAVTAARSGRRYGRCRPSS